MQKAINWSQRPPMVERKRQRKLSGYICCYFYNFICFISLYALVSSLFVFHCTCKKIKKLVAGPLTAGAPCHGTIGTMGNLALVVWVRPVWRTDKKPWCFTKAQRNALEQCFL